jgi:hypothetical protein
LLAAHVICSQSDPFPGLIFATKQFFFGRAVLSSSVIVYFIDFFISLALGPLDPHSSWLLFLLEIFISCSLDFALSYCALESKSCCQIGFPARIFSPALFFLPFPFAWLVFAPGVPGTATTGHGIPFPGLLITRQRFMCRANTIEFCHWFSLLRELGASLTGSEK